MQRTHQVRADVPLETSPADREHEQHVLRLQATALEPRREGMLPSLIVRAGRQFRHVVDRGIRLNAGNFPEIVHGMRAIGGAAAHAEKKQPAAAGPQVSQQRYHLLDYQRVEAGHDAGSFVEMLFGVAHRVDIPFAAR